ncbi:MAG: F0F1 ATP synthase subunit B [Cypionkella sp.]|nr:F0F1 ATP synthase subunit B [Cypionkella sp.]
MTRFAILALTVAASPAFAATGPFFSLRNTNFVVLLAFLVFVGILIWKKVPALIGGMLDKRAAQIEADLTEARALRDEAKALLASYEKKQKDVAEQSARIIASAKEEAEAAAAAAKDDLTKSIARRLAAASDQIASAESAAIATVRNQAISVAVAAAGEVLAKQSNASNTSASIDAAIAAVDAKFH